MKKLSAQLALILLVFTLVIPGFVIAQRPNGFGYLARQQTRADGATAALPPRSNVISMKR